MTLLDPEERADLGLHSVFVGGPFLGTVDQTTGTVPRAHRTHFEWLFTFFENREIQVYNAHRREEWGAKFLGDHECTKLDFIEISQADVFVAFPGEPPSPGTHVEFGWASATGKPIVALLREDQHYAPLITGLTAVADIEFVRFGENFGSAPFERHLEDALRTVLGSRHDGGTPRVTRPR